MTLKAGFKQCKTDTCLLYRWNELRAVIIIVYVDDTMAIGDKPELMNTTYFIKKSFATRLTGELKDFKGCTIKH